MKEFSNWLSGVFLALVAVCDALAAPDHTQPPADKTAPVDSAPVDTVLVCPKEYLKPMERWIGHREKQGHRIAVIQDTDQQKIRQSVRQIANRQKPGALRYLVLAADVPDPSGGTTGIAPHLVKAEINIKWGSEPEIATDNRYADLDDDGVPDLAVGRLSANSADQMTTIVKKIIDYESRPAPGLWKRKVNFVAGVGGFGALADAILERSTRTFISKNIPAAYQTPMTYASWRSPFCPDPRRFRNETLDRMNDGSLFWIYIGHGQRRALDWIRVPTGAAPIFNEDDYQHVDIRQGAPIAVFLSCYAGAFDDPKDCLADQLLRQPKGPVAIVCGSRVTMPYAMAVLSNLMLKECFGEQNPCLGDIFLISKQKMADSAERDGDRFLLDALAKAISPEPNKLGQERIEHLSLMNLIGDPLLRLKHPKKVKVEAVRAADQGETVQVQFDCPLAGKCTLELVCERGNVTFDLPKRTKFDATHKGMHAMNDVYKKAIDDRWHHMEFDAAAGKTRKEIPIAESAIGACRIRVFVEGPSDFAIGSTKIFVRRPKKDAPSSDEGPDKSSSRQKSTR